MALQSSGSISLNQIHVEAGGSSGSGATINDADIRGLINKASEAQMSFNEWYGASAETVLTSGGNVNGQAQRKQISVSSFISSGETFRIPSNMWVWSDNTSVAALTIDIPCTVINDGKIIGKGGEGGWGFSSIGPTAGGPAINVTSSGVTITNSSGAYIAGGGGGGGAYSDYSNPSDAHAGGGGGAGGGKGGRGRTNSGYWHQGSGGALNASGATGGNGSGGAGGGAGGAGGGHQGGAGGGGRILPGVGGGVGSYSSNGDGGSAGNAGVSGGPYVYSVAGGGGGWGAAGGLGGGRYAGATGGAAIQGTSRTLNNSGTIYGST
tara:strand:- start:5341 stop:6306 length:966 start_codon:yes stop_codon:yes gene_type:complete